MGTSRHDSDTALLAAGLALLALLAGARAQWPGSVPELCVVPTSFPIRPYSTTCSDVPASLPGGCAAPRASVSAQRGETEDVQLLLRRGADADDLAGGVRNVAVSVAGLPSNVTAAVFRVGYVRAEHTPRYSGSGGGWRPDPLLPLPPGATFSVPSAVAQPLYVSLRVARGAVPGNYSNSSVVVSYDDAASTRRQLVVALSVEIFSTQLPPLSETNLGSAWSGSWDAQTFAPYLPGGSAAAWNDTTKHRWFDLMIEHRMPPDAIYLRRPRDFQDYAYMADKGVKWFALLDVSSLQFPSSSPAGRTATDAHPHHGGGVEGSCRNFTDAYVEHMLATLSPIVAALEQKDLLSRAYVYGFDENPVSCEPQVRKLFGATKKAFPALKTAAVLNWSPMPVDLPVDIWILQYEKFDADNAKAWIAQGKVQWHYHCIEPNAVTSLNTFIERPPFQARLLLWLAASRQLRHGAPSGWLYYAVNLWRPCDNPLCTANVTNKAPLVQNMSSPFVQFPVGNYIWQPAINDIFANGDGQFVYPCEGGLPCGSVRLSALRDGLEDWDGLLSVASDPAAAAQMVEQVVRGPDDWDWLGWRRMEQIRQMLGRR